MTLPTRRKTLAALVGFAIDRSSGERAAAADDHTDVIQAALNNARGKSLTLAAGTYNVGPLYLPDGIRLRLAAGVRLRSDFRRLRGNHKLLNIGGSDISLDARGASIEIDSAGFRGEHNHGVSIISARGRVEVVGLSSNGSGGDGFYVKSPDADVVLLDCSARRNRRQGLSVIECRSFTDKGGYYANTSGAAPSCGVDIEPNGPDDRLGPIRFSRTVAEGNNGGGFLVFLYRWARTGNKADIVFDHCVSRGNSLSRDDKLRQLAGFEVRRIPQRHPCYGTISFIDCRSENDGHAGFRVYDKDVRGPLVEIIRPMVLAANRTGAQSAADAAGIAVYNDDIYTRTPGGVTIKAPVVVQGDGNMLDAIHVSSKSAPHRRLLIENVQAVGRFGAGN